MGDTTPAPCFTHSPGETAVLSFAPLHFYFGQRCPGSPGRRWKQDAPVLIPLPARGFCVSGRKGYGLLPVLIKTMDNLLFSKE